MLLNCGVGEDSWESLGRQRSNQSTWKEISPEYSLEGLVLKLKLQYFGHLIQKADSLEKTLMLEKIDSRRRGRQRMRWLDSITNSMDKFEQALVKMVKDREAWCIAIQPVSRTHWATEQFYLHKSYIYRICIHISIHNRMCCITISNKLLSDQLRMRKITLPLFLLQCFSLIGLFDL